MERPFRRPTVTDVNAKFVTVKPNNRKQVALARCGHSILTPAFAPVGGRENAIVPTRTSTHHLILHELVRHIRHLGQNVSPPLGLRLPSRSREPVRRESHCAVHPGHTVNTTSGGSTRKRVTYEEGPGPRGRLQARRIQKTGSRQSRQRLR